MTNLFVEVTSETWTNWSGFVTSAVVTFRWPAWVLAGTIVLWTVSRRKVRAGGLR